MAMQTGKSPVAGKLKGIAGAAAASRGKPIEIGRSRLPTGIDNGVARLSQIGIGTYESDHKVPEFHGKLYFSAMGVVVLPVEHEGKPTRGLQTWLQREPLFDTPKAGGKRKTLSDHFQFMRSHLTGLGFDVDEALSSLPPNVTDDQVAAAIEAGCKALEQAKPYFRFRTWQGKKAKIVNENGKWYLDRGRGGRLGPYSSEDALLKINKYAKEDPLVNEQWEGAVDFSENGEAPSAVEDNTGEVATEEAATEGEAATEEGGGDAGETPNFDAMTVEELAVAAQEFADDSNTEGENAAGMRLLDIAEGLGIRDAVDVSDTWADGLALIQEAQAAAEGGDTTPDEPRVPEKGEVWRYAPPDPKNPKKRGKKVEVIIAFVNAAKGTATLTDNTTKKPVVGGKDKKPIAVPFAELEPPE